MKTTILLFLLSVNFVYSGNRLPSKASLACTGLYEEFMHISPDPAKSVIVKNFVLRRDRGTFLFKEGQIFLGTPVKGRVCAAVFHGKGRFQMIPPSEIERKQLSRFYEKDSLDEPFEDLFMMFADSTYEELLHGFSFSDATPPHAARVFIESALKYLSDRSSESFDENFMETFLQVEHNSLFFAHFSESAFHPMYFEVDPFAEEEVSFGRRRSNAAVPMHEAITQFNSGSVLESALGVSPRSNDRIKIGGYLIDATIEDDLDFSACTLVSLLSLRDNQEWLKFYLYSKLSVDSVIWDSGALADYHKGEDQSELWIHCAAPLIQGQACSVKVYYHGDLLARDELGWITIRDPHTWYPRYGYRTQTRFDMTFHTPVKYKFACVGEKIAASESSEISTTRWVTRVPTHNASFNIGRFEESEIKDERIPSITVQMAEHGHSEIGLYLAQQGVLSGSNMEKQVGEDISNSIRFYQEVYGKCFVDHLYATEIPQLHGEAFPGLVHLAWATFQRTDKSGADEVFRAHEVAHQWWGIGVGFATYHDQWLSEGFADYSGLWYMQTVLKDNKKFFRLLDEWKERILKNRHYLFENGQEAGPICLGYRTQSSETRGDYSLIIYKKGAWVLHMLRNMMLDLKSMSEDRFINMMREFYAKNLGKTPSTRDFQAVVSKYCAEDMGWFFDQWVYETYVPEYKFSYHTVMTPQGKFKVSCRVEQDKVPDQFKMYVPILLKFEGDRYARVRVLVTGKKCEFDLPLVPIEPEKIVFNDLHSVLCEVEDTDWE